MRKKSRHPYLYDLFWLKESGQLVDPNEVPEFEIKFIYPISIIGMVFSVMSILFNIFWSFNEHLNIVGYVAFVFYLIIYFFSGKKKYVSITKWVTILVTMGLINYGWYFDYRTHGPAIYLLFLLFGYLTFMLGRKDLILVSVFLLVDFLILFLFDYGGYLPVVQYPNKIVLMVEIYSSVVLYTIVAFVLVRRVRKIYFAEYNKALESDRLKTAFLANISHEIRTPLNAIVGFSNLMLTEDVSLEDKKNYKGIINQNNKFLLELVNDILDISMIESNNVQREDKINNLNLIMYDLEKAYSNTLVKLEKDKIRLIKKVPEQEVLIFIDGNYLERALRHLLDNAVKFTEEGEIEFGFHVEGKIIKFFVKDTGIGVKEKDKRNLFERFNKNEYSRKRFQAGTGIGLYLVKLIVNMFGGDVSAESTFGKGSTFSFTIPAKDLKMDE